ncbi:hypothetical protein [Nocardia exalbida]|uniref:hypothetical protein n=1 Tax=Nocardia exalbida TaxID=290231 RepID=UPI0012F67C54|nr:hypothetical protein [Nocardia exalbida]
MAGGRVGPPRLDRGVQLFLRRLLQPLFGGDEFDHAVLGLAHPRRGGTFLLGGGHRVGQIRRHIGHIWETARCAPVRDAVA